MTNEYNPDSQPPHDHVVEEEQPAHEVEHDVAADDQPPFDDFADSGTAAEETATVSQETVAETDEMAPVESRSRSMLPIFAGIGGILLLGAVVYWQFGHSSSSTPPPLPAMTAQAPAQKWSPPPAASTPSSTSGSVSEADIKALYKPAPETSLPPVPTPMDAALTTPTTAMAAALPPAARAPAEGTTMPTPSTTPTTAMAGVALPAQAQGGLGNSISPHIPPPAFSQNSGMPPVHPAAVGANDLAEQARLNALTVRIDSLQKSLDEQSRQLNQVSNMVAANQAVPPASSHADMALQARFQKIDQLLMKLEHDEAAQVSATSTFDTSRDTGKTSSNYATSAKHKAAPKKSKTARHHKAPASAGQSSVKTASTAPAWVLRAATPNEAWVSGNATSPELRHIQVGDTLPGVGTVRAIRQSQNGWEIEGTAGIVR